MPPFWMAASVMTGSLSFIAGPRPRPSPRPCGAPAPRSPACPATSTPAATMAATRVSKVAVNRVGTTLIIISSCVLLLRRGSICVIVVPADVEPGDDAVDRREPVIEIGRNEHHVAHGDLLVHARARHSLAVF